MQKRSLRILVAEDVEINRELLRVMLEQRGHAVTPVENGAAALAALERQPFDIIVMDVQMPVMDGIEATRRIRALPGPERDIPIIALTANVLADARQAYRDAGMTACLDKPIAWGELDETLARLTSPKNSEAEPLGN